MQSPAISHRIFRYLMQYFSVTLMQSEKLITWSFGVHYCWGLKLIARNFIGIALNFSTFQEIGWYFTELHEIV